MYLCHSENLMPKDTKSLGNNKAPACESWGFVLKKKKVRILTHLLLYYILISDDYLNLSAALTITSSRPIERIASIFRMIETRGKQSAQPIRKRFSSFFNAK